MKNSRAKTRHHLIPKERQRKKTYKENQIDLHLDTVLKLWRDKHDAWHLLFKNMTIDEIILCLYKVKMACLTRQARKKLGKVLPMNDQFFETAIQSL